MTPEKATPPIVDEKSWREELRMQNRNYAAVTASLLNRFQDTEIFLKRDAVGSGKWRGVQVVWTG